MTAGVPCRRERERSRRIRLVALLLMVPFALAGVRVVQLSTFGAHSPEHRALMSLAEATPWRRELVDRNGELLASNLETVSLYAEPHRIWDARGTAEDIARILPDQDIDRLAARLASDRAYVPIERHLTPRAHEQLFALGRPGLGFEPQFRRVYPQKDAAAHVVGFANIDGQGLAGAERAFDAELAENDHAPLALSLDMRVQAMVREELATGLARSEAQSGIAIVMNVDTGEVISLVSLPDYDPHQPARSMADARVNRAFNSVFELGSVFKVFAYAAALDSGRLALNERLDLPEELRLGRHVIRDTHPVAPDEAGAPIMQFAQSSNIASASIALRLSGEEYGRYLKDWRLLERADIGFAESAGPILPDDLTAARRASMSYGYGMSVTPISFLSAFNTTVNGGFYVRPTLERVDERTGSHRERVLSPRTSDDMRTLLRAAVELGTGRRAQVDGYAIGGKTGTALKLVDGAYDESTVVSTFVAAFPIDQPEYSVLVLYDEPKGDGEVMGRFNAGYVAAPVAAEIIERVGPILGITPSSDGRSLTRIASNEAAP